MIVDLHNHAENSLDSTVGLRDYVAHPHRVAVAITEHNRLPVSSGRVDGVWVIPGIELLHDCGDFLIFAAPQSCIAEQDIFRLIDAVHECGGVIIAAHPFSGWGVCRVSEPDLAHEIVSRADAIESWNGRTPEEAWRLAEEMAQQLGKPEVGGSDAHAPDEMFRVGTWFGEPVESAEDVARAVRMGRCAPVRLPHTAS